MGIIIPVEFGRFVQMLVLDPSCALYAPNLLHLLSVVSQVKLYTYTRMRAHVCPYTQTFIHMHIRTRTSIYMDVHTRYTHSCTRMHKQTHNAHAHACAPMHACRHVRTQIRTQTSTDARICAHTQTYKHACVLTRAQTNMVSLWFALQMQISQSLQKLSCHVFQASSYFCKTTQFSHCMQKQSIA